MRPLIDLEDPFSETESTESSTKFRAGLWAQLIKGAQCIKKIDELHLAISFSKPRKFKTNIAFQ